MPAAIRPALPVVLPLALLAAPALAADAPALRPAPLDEHRRACAGKDGWSDPAPPIRIFANVYDVGTCGIVVLLVAGPAGHILIDGATAEAAPGVLANLRRLGVRPDAVKLLLSSHEHLDHAGGLAAIRRATGARMLAVAAARPTLESGGIAADDPQRGGLSRFPGVRVDRLVRDGEVVRLGPLRLTAHATPGHAPGGTSWSWRSCAGTVCRAIVYADSVKAIAADGYRFADHPRYVAAFRTSLGRIAALPCDILVTPHPSVSRLYERLARPTTLAGADGCRSYAADGHAALDARLQAETVTPPPAR